jgi:hypothetical protein
MYNISEEEVGMPSQIKSPSNIKPTPPPAPPSLNDLQAAAEEPPASRLKFIGMEDYEHAALEVYKALESLVSRGLMTEDVSARILRDCQYSFWQSLVQINYE